MPCCISSNKNVWLGRSLVLRENLFLLLREIVVVINGATRSSYICIHRVVHFFILIRETTFCSRDSYKDLQPFSMCSLSDFGVLSSK